MATPFSADQAIPAENDDDIAAEPGPLEDLDAFQRVLRQLIHDQLQIAALELRLAMHGLMAMVAAAVCIGALLVLAWAGLMAAIGLGLMALNVPPTIAMLVLTALTAGLALQLRRFIIRRSRALGLPATLRSLKPSAPGRTRSETT